MSRNYEKLRIAQHNWYINNKQLTYYRCKTRRKRLRIFINSLKTKCIKCGEDDIRCLDFHHITSNKIITISRLISQVGWNEDKILKEIDKCILLCANCHRKEHAPQKYKTGTKSSYPKWFIELKYTLKCSKCDERDHPCCLDFHHINPSIKKDNVTRLATRHYSKRSIIDEIKKCIVLCANCHRKETFKE